MNYQLLPILWTALAVLQNPLPLDVPAAMSPGDVVEVYCWIPPGTGAGWTAEIRNNTGDLMASARFFDLPESWEVPGFRLALLALGACRAWDFDPELGSRDDQCAEERGA